jgi:hypothetical protein
MSETVDHLWELVEANPRLDASLLARAVEDACESADDFRTRLLIRDSIRAIEHFWNSSRAQEWLNSSPRREKLREICEAVYRDEVDEHGFPSLKRRIVDAIRPDKILSYFNDLATHIRQPTHLVVGGAIPLIMAGHLLRKTEDIDVVDEVPANIRTEYKLLEELEDQYGLQLTHFQSHYLPTGWEQRLQSLGTFGPLQVSLVDVYDAFVTKLFSNRRKDKEDLRAVVPHLDRLIIEDRLRSSAASFLADAKLRASAEQNWRILFNEALPA